MAPSRGCRAGCLVKRAAIVGIGGTAVANEENSNRASSAKTDQKDDQSDKEQSPATLTARGALAQSQPQAPAKEGFEAVSKSRIFSGENCIVRLLKR